MPAPKITVFNCKHGTTLPGIPVAAPGNDATSKRAFAETAAVAAFYEQLFGRNSVDDAGKTLLSSVHFSVGYNNAFWNGTQMVYGDGDGNIFVDFTKASDVIGHELTHGVTQFSAQLEYSDEPGGLNESVSDVFGSMFKQWRKSQTVDKADWLIGKEIIGPGAKARGFECLRDMSNPRRQALSRTSADALLAVPARNGPRTRAVASEPCLPQRGRRDRRVQLAESRNDLVQGADGIRPAAKHEDESVCANDSESRQDAVPARRKHVRGRRQSLGRGRPVSGGAP